MAGERMQATLTDEGRALAARLAASHRSPEEWAAITQATPEDMTDEALAKIAWQAYIAHDDDGFDPMIDPMIDVVRAVRAALQPEVTPLESGETVTILDHDGCEIRISVGDGGYFRADFPYAEYPTYLDAEGVRQLRDACNRCLARSHA